MFPLHLMTTMSQKWDLLEKRTGHMLESMNHRRLRVSRRRCTALLSSFRLREWPPSSIFFFQAQGEEASESTKALTIERTRS